MTEDLKTKLASLVSERDFFLNKASYLEKDRDFYRSAASRVIDEIKQLEPELGINVKNNNQ